jgi:hypothetical protein
MVPGGQTILGQVVARHLPRIESRDIATGHFSQMGENTQGYFFFFKTNRTKRTIKPQQQTVCNVQCVHSDIQATLVPTDREPAKLDV